MILKIEFEIELPDLKDYDDGDKNLDEYLKYSYNVSNALKMSNPFITEKNLKPVDGTFFWHHK